MKPTIGRIVYFVLDNWSAAQLGGNHAISLGADSSLVVNDNRRVAPAMIVSVWNDTCVNLKVFGDSDRDVWVTSVGYDETAFQPRSWHWPPKI